MNIYHLSPKQQFKQIVLGKEGREGEKESRRETTPHLKFGGKEGISDGQVCRGQEGQVGFSVYCFTAPIPVWEAKGGWEEPAL